MFPMAITCGNTYILKPSERVPSAVTLMINLLHETKIPAGVVNVVQGTWETTK